MEEQAAYKSGKDGELAVCVDEGVKFSLISYDEARKSIRFKKYSNSTDFNMHRNGWMKMHEFESDAGEPSRRQVEGYIRAIKQNGDYCYRRFQGGCWNLPFISIYRKET